MAPFHGRRPIPAAWRAIPLVVAAWSCGDPSPLAPDPNQRLTGTYTFTVALSASCPKRGSWNFRADFKQVGRDVDITLYEGDFNVSLGFTSDSYNHFRGQDNPDGVLFFAPGGVQGEVLFSEKDAGAWGPGQARGPFSNSRIDALFNGRVSPSFFDNSGCVARDHSWTFVRR